MLAVVFGLVASAPLWAQTTSASVSGTVKDAQGGVLPGVTVALTSVSRGTETVVVTDGLGNFLFPVVQPDTYNIKVALEGFQTLQQQSVKVDPNARLSVGPYTLQVGSMQESITVVAQSESIQLKSGERAYTLESTAMQNIAVNGRSLFQLAMLVPGVLADSPTQVSGMNANGQRANSNNMTIDGVANIDTGDNGGNMATTNLDAVSEFKVLTSSYQAEFGRAVGAQVQVVTKSGSKNFSGSAYWYNRRSWMNANSWTNNRNGIKMSSSKRDDYGYTLGGPLYIPGLFNKNRDKLFFFFNQEFQRRKDPTGESRVTVPTALERKGDFSQSLDANGNPYPYIKDYTLNLPCSSTNTSGCFQDGGVLGRIPASRLYAPTLAALSLFPTANVGGQVGYNYTSQKPATQPHTEELIRLDYQANSNWRMTGRLMLKHELFQLPYGIGGWSIGGNLDTINVTQKTPGSNWLVSTVGILNNTTSLEVSVGSAHNSLDHFTDDTNWTRKHLTELAGGQSLPMFNTTAIQNDYVPSFGWGGGRIANTPQMRTNQAPFSNFNTTYDVVANLTKVMGAHATKAGVYFQRSLKPQSAFANFNGAYDFANSSSNPLDSQHPFANAALGIYNSFSQASEYRKPNWVYKNLEWYLQDNWKTSDRLTLDYGVRFYFLTPQWDTSKVASNWLADKYDPSKTVRLYKPTVVNGVRVGYDAVTGGVVDSAYIGRVVPNSGDRFNGAFQAGKGISDTLTDGNKFRISPRLGFAYDITGQQKIVARGGFGIFYDRPQGNQVFDLVNNPPGMQIPTVSWGLVSSLAGATPLFGALGVQANVYNWKIPTVYQWNLGVQYRLPAQFTLDVAYVGSKSDNLLQFRNLNAVPYGTFYNTANNDPTRGQTCTGCSSLSTLPGGNAIDPVFVRTYQGFNDVRLWEFEAYSDYKALQNTISRRFSKGLMFSVNYTWAKAQGTLGGDWDYARIDGKDREANYGPLSFDRTHSLVLSFVYQMPKVVSGPVGYITNDWQLSGSYRYMSGTPASAGFSIPGIGNTNLTGSSTEGARIALTGTGVGKGWSSDPYNQFDINAFKPPQPGSIGLESPRYVFRNPPIDNWDLSLSKSVSLSGRRRLELRLDAFNVLNHTQFSGVNRTINYTSLTDATVTNKPYNASNVLTNRNGVGTISGVRNPRQLQFVTRFSF